MRILQQWHDDHGGGATLENSSAHRRGYARSIGRQSVPLWYTSAHLAGCETGLKTHVGRGIMTETQGGQAKPDQPPAPSGQAESFWGKRSNRLDDWLAIEPDGT